MADDKDEAARVAAAIKTSKSREKPADEAIPGGSYIAADQKTRINANGEPIDESGKVLKPKPE